ncbi:diacylglycerol O-acyltransferase 2-like isoform X3 [Hyla sarda]|uniref:diacylglycerol O-acyltransferase 2-like isoform X3 n=1 Tax=Hyla sarda TaxID=327740 RepID=UPI0024C43083|nr:diacylglycerol O-acyltransferase 2-like isoform X3 [Hyla sarda]
MFRCLTKATAAYQMDSHQEREQRQRYNCTYSELLQTLSVFQWILTFLLLGPVCALLVSWVIYSRLWPLFAIYIIWMISDWKTPERGGRKSLWMSKWTMWKHFKDYFPIKLHKMAELDPKHNYIFAYHPHGIMSIGAFCNFGTESTGFSQIFPNIKPHLTTLAGNFKVPFYRDYLLAAGGAAEALNCARNKHILTLKKRKGFIRKALANGASLVPVYSFGENEVLEQYHFEPGSWKRTLQETFQQWIGFAPCIFFGQGFFSSASKGIMPLRKAINTVVGKPIPVPKVENPSEQQVDTYHTMYIKSLRELFNAHKEQFGLQQSDSLMVV